MGRVDFLKSTIDSSANNHRFNHSRARWPLPTIFSEPPKCGDAGPQAHTSGKNLHFLKIVLYLSMKKYPCFRSRISWLFFPTQNAFYRPFRRLHHIIHQYYTFLFKSAPSKSFFSRLPDSSRLQNFFRLFSTLQIVQNVFFTPDGHENRVFSHLRSSQSVQNVQPHLFHESRVDLSANNR
jgi:hypothetical protein